MHAASGGALNLGLEMSKQAANRACAEIRRFSPLPSDSCEVAADRGPAATSLREVATSQGRAATSP